MLEPLPLHLLRRWKNGAFVLIVAGFAVAALDRGWCGDPPIVVVPPTAEELPEFGEYVYVEELPEAIKKPGPVYPEAARNLAGTVMVQALVGKDGRVIDTKIMKSIPMLDQAAVDCVRQWEFKPALAKGQPVAVWVAVPIRFGAGAESPPSMGNEPPMRTPPPPPPGVRRAAPTRLHPAKLQAQLDAAMAELRAQESGPPSPGNEVLRERIIRTARRMGTLPVPEDVRARFERALEGRGGRPSDEDLVRELSRIVVDCPWFAEPYRVIATSLERLEETEAAITCLELYLVASPDAEDWEEVRTSILGLDGRLDE